MYFLKKGIIIVFGSIFISLGINLFLSPYEVLDGGVIGIGLILNYILGLKTGLMILLCSIPIFTIAWFYYREYFYNSLHGMMISSLFIDLLEPVRSIFHIEAIYSSIIGGVLIGAGIGVMLRYRTSTGGTDLIAQFIGDKTGINVGLLILFMDSIILLIGGVLLSSDTIFFSAITILVVGLITSLMTKNLPAA
ncbi:YitT family protein [Robertmurraya massiliosenegalensis]|uniref:YitT family protein n=1 Tax=Robertmurraya massiliosenegalensis TaxID=1287657 RepID=UPI0002F28CF6|nr:YitT family protein [Robertmurraya massiliosenegalensis]